MGNTLPAMPWAKKWGKLQSLFFVGFSPPLAALRLWGEIKIVILPRDKNEATEKHQEISQNTSLFIISKMFNSARPAAFRFLYKRRMKKGFYEELEPRLSARGLAGNLFPLI